MMDEDAYFRAYAAELGRKNARLVAQILYWQRERRLHGISSASWEK